MIRLIRSLLEMGLRYSLSYRESELIRRMLAALTDRTQRWSRRGRCKGSSIDYASSSGGNNVHRYKTQTRTIAVTADGSGIAKFGPAKNRCSLIIGCTTPTAFALQFGSQPDATNGVGVNASPGHIHLSDWDMGDALDGPYTVVTTAGTVVCAIETVYMP